MENAENSVSEALKFQNVLEAFLQKIHKRFARPTEFPQFRPRARNFIQKCQKLEYSFIYLTVKYLNLDSFIIVEFFNLTFD